MISKVSGSRARLRKSLARSAAVVLLLSACSNHDSGTPPGGWAPGQGGNAPSKAMDLDPVALSPNGCLNLQLISEKLKGLPSETRLRSYSSDFDMKKAEGSKGSIRSHFLSEMSFRHFTFNEKSASIELSDWPTVTQSDCSSVDLTRLVDGVQTLRIDTESTTPTLLKLRSDDGNETIYELIGPRRLEIRSVEHGFDTCPDHVKVEMTTRRIYEWGTEPDLAALPIEVARDFLKKLRSAVVEMPESLDASVIYETTPFVKVAANDLRALAGATVSNDVLRCPYRPKPPTGDEPPPEPDPTPTPVPQPTPASDAPAPTPQLPGEPQPSNSSSDSREELVRSPFPRMP